MPVFLPVPGSLPWGLLRHVTACTVTCSLGFSTHAALLPLLASHMGLSLSLSREPQTSLRPHARAYALTRSYLCFPHCLSLLLPLSFSPPLLHPPLFLTRVASFSLVVSLTHTLSPLLSHALSLSLPHSQSLSLRLSHPLTVSLSFSLSPSPLPRSLYRSLSLPLSPSLFLCCSCCISL